LISGNVLGQQPTWRLANGTAGRWISAVDVYRSNPDTALALTSDGLFRSTNRGESWDSISYMNSSPGDIAIDPRDSRVIYVSVFGFAIPGNDIYRSTDGGSTWGLPLFIGVTYPVWITEFDPIDPGTVYVGVGPGRLYRSSNVGQSWDTIRIGGGYLISLSIAQSNNNILYAGYIRGISKSTDRGSTWTPLSLGFQPPEGVLVAVDPSDANVAYAAVWNNGAGPGGMYKTTDGGSTWNEINVGIDSQHQQVQALTINPKNPDEILLGVYASDRIVLRTTNGGATWGDFADGMFLPGRVNAIAFDTLNNRVYASVSSGLYIHETLTSVSSVSTMADYNILSQNYPNPFNPTTTITFTTHETGNATVRIFDILGREVMSLLNQRISPGQNRVVLDASSLPAGVYFYTLRIADFMATKHMILLR
jgi:hypothetical protein